MLCALAVSAFAQTALAEQQRAVRHEAPQEIRAAKSTFHEETQQRLEEFRAMMDAQRGIAKDAVKTKREELRKRLSVIRDEQKKKKVENINMRMDALNERWTAHFSLALERLENVLEKITERAAEAAEKGSDVAAVNAAITSVKASFAISRTQIVLQAGKTYAIIISTENALQADVKKTRQALHDDLAAVRETVKSARDAAHNAATALAQAMNNKESKQITQ